MKKLFRLCLPALFISFLLTGCYYDKEDVLYPSPPACDTTAVTYTLSISPIMVSHCNVCHSTTLANGGVVTDTWDGLSKVANNGKLWPAVSHTGPISMPQGSDKLSDCNLALINIWIRDGAKNN
jgi:hypothetical protein